MEKMLNTILNCTFTLIVHVYVLDCDDIIVAIIISSICSNRKCNLFGVHLFFFYSFRCDKATTSGLRVQTWRA